jgi:hypothetical protein
LLIQSAQVALAALVRLQPQPELVEPQHLLGLLLPLAVLVVMVQTPMELQAQQELELIMAAVAEFTLQPLPAMAATVVLE